jgi:hypothetical protein
MNAIVRPDGGARAEGDATGGAVIAHGGAGTTACQSCGRPKWSSAGCGRVSEFDARTQSGQRSCPSPSASAWSVTPCLDTHWQASAARTCARACSNCAGPHPMLSVKSAHRARLVWIGVTEPSLFPSRNAARSRSSGPKPVEAFSVGRSVPFRASAPLLILFILLMPAERAIALGA